MSLVHSILMLLLLLLCGFLLARIVGSLRRRGICRPLVSRRIEDGWPRGSLHDEGLRIPRSLELLLLRGSCWLLLLLLLLQRGLGGFGDCCLLLLL